METIREYLADGLIISEFEVENGKRNGRGKIWSSSGALIFEATFVDGLISGLVLEWSETGSLTLRAHKTSGMYDGLYESWWDDGCRKELGVFVAGVRQRGYQWFDKNGEVWSTY